MRGAGEVDLASTLQVITKRPLLLGALLVVTIFGMITAVIVTSRSYEASGEVLLLPAPEVPPSTDPTVPAPSTNNPYLRLELSDVADASSARVSSRLSTIALQHKGSRDPTSSWPTPTFNEARSCS